MSRRAFTLVELLVVIAIMVTLMSLIMGGVMLAKRIAMRAKATALLGAVASAIDQYRSLNNVYPELKKYDSTISGMPSMPSDLSIADGDDVYGKVFAPPPSGTIQTATAIYNTDPDKDGWTAINSILIYQLGSLISEHAPTGQAIDPWKKPLRYRPSKWYPYTLNDPIRIDSDKPPGADSYQLWSAGPDGKDEATDKGPGESGDDMPSWAKSQ